MARRSLPLHDWSLGAASRRILLELLANETPRTAGDLVSLSGLSSATVHQNLRALVELDLLDPAADGYRLRGADSGIEDDVVRRLADGQRPGEVLAVALRMVVITLRETVAGAGRPPPDDP